MAIKKAKVLTDEQYSVLLGHIADGKHPERDRVILALSYKCGLRACEIARLKWSHVVDAADALLPVGSWIELSHDITKGKRPDTKITVHPALYEALAALRALGKPTPFLCYAPFGGSMSVNNVTVYLHQLYDRFGFEGCSSHSGRRTFITKLARTANDHKCSIKDVQLLARHASMRSTERYIEPSIRIHELALSA